MFVKSQKTRLMMSNISTEVLKYNIATSLNTDAGDVVAGTQIPYTIPHIIPSIASQTGNDIILNISTSVLKYNIVTTLMETSGNISTTILKYNIATTLE